MKVSIYQICLAGTMTAVAILLGAFATIHIGGGGVYLVGISIFLMPLVLRLPLLIISTTISIVITDLITGWIAWTWISVIAYLSAVVTIWAFVSFIRIKIFYMIGTLIACFWIVAIYYLLEIPTFGRDLAIKDTITTAIEVAIVWPIINILYLPFRMIPKVH